MKTVKDVYDKIDLLAPFSSALPYDNCGILVGCGTDVVEKTMVVLDITNGIIDEAIANGINLIVSHHPIIFTPVKSINNILHRVVANSIAVIAAHTNIDVHCLNDVLAERLSLLDITGDGFYRIGKLPYTMDSRKLSSYVQERLNSFNVAYTVDCDNINTVAVSSGAGSEIIYDVKADAFITGETKHNILIDAVNNNKVLMTVGHYESEVIVCSKLVDYLSDVLPDVKFFTSVNEKNPNIYCK